MKVLQQYVIGFIFLISCLLSAGNAPAADEDKIAGVLTAGETGYEIPVKVVNNNREPMQDVTVAIEDYPAGLVNFRVTPRPDSPISPGKSFVFLVSFDVAEDAKANDKAKIILSVTAPGVVFDNPSPQLTVTIEEKSEVSRTSTILRLVEIAEVPEHITSAWEGQHESGASGVSLRMEEKQILDYICPKGVTWGGCNGQKQEWQDFRTWQKKISSLKIMD